MLFIYILFGFFLGLNIFFYSYLKIHKTKFLAIPPIFVFLLAIICTGYGLLAVDDGWEGMTYGIISFGMLISTIIGAAIIPILYRQPIHSLNKKVKRCMMIILGASLMLCMIILIFPDPFIGILD